MVQPAAQVQPATHVQALECDVRMRDLSVAWQASKYTCHVHAAILPARIRTLSDGEGHKDAY